MKINEKQLRKMISERIIKLLKESEDDELEMDDWNAPDEFSQEEDEPVEISDDDIVLDPQEKPEDKKKADSKRERVAEIFRNILSKQGFSGEKLEREIEKRLGRSSTKTDAATRRSDHSFEAFDEPVTVGGKNIGYVGNGGIWDDDNDLYESVSRIVKKVLRESIEDPTEQFAEIITSLDSNTARLIAAELHRGGADETMRSIIDSFNGSRDEWNDERIQDNLEMQADY
jgi:hypothetical protein